MRYYLAPNGFKFGLLRRIQRRYDRLRGATGGREAIPWVGCPGGYPEFTVVAIAAEAFVVVALVAVLSDRSMFSL